MSLHAISRNRREQVVTSSVAGVHHTNHRPRKYIKSEFTISAIDRISLDLSNFNRAAAMSIESLVRLHFCDLDRLNDNKEILA